MDVLPDIAPCGYFTFTQEGVLLSGNARFSQDTGISEFSGQPVDTCLTLASRIFYQTHLFPLIRMQGHAEEIFLTLLSNNRQPLPVLLNIASATINAQVIYACAYIVVHQRKHFEDELVAARKKAEQALAENTTLIELRDQLLQQGTKLDQQLQLISEQNEELRQFNHVVTHELQEPLRKIQLFSGMIQTMPSDQPDKEKVISRLSRATDQMRKVITGLQQYLWIDEATIDPVHIDLPSLLSHVANQLHQEYEGVPLELHIGDLPAFSADAAHIERLVYEILSNSIQFRKSGQPAKVSVTATLLKKNAYRMTPGKYAYEDAIDIRFSDEGQGFDPQYLPIVQQLFQRLAIGAGRGIGLALCKKIVEKHQGTIALATQEGIGTTVNITFPLLRY